MEAFVRKLILCISCRVELLLNNFSSEFLKAPDAFTFSMVRENQLMRSDEPAKADDDVEMEEESPNSPEDESASRLKWW